MKRLGVALAVVAAVSADEANQIEFMQFMGRYGKSYKTVEEFEMRLERFNKIDKFIKEHQAKEGRNFEVGHNKFSDWTEAERKSHLGFKRGRPQFESDEANEEVDLSRVPKSVDWRKEGAVTPVKDQGQCGSCWAFATSAILEGAHKIESGQLLSFSEQLWVDCVKDQSDYGYISEPQPCCHGCNGGDYDASFQYAMTNKTQLVRESSYPYQMVEGTCDYESKSKTRVQVVSKTDVPRNDPKKLKEAVAKQPVGVGVAASSDVFHQYTGGIIDDAEACGTDEDHAITIVGYGKDNHIFGHTDYWIVKNSWGEDWGENGYVRIANTGKNNEGVCMINHSPGYAMTSTE